MYASLCFVFLAVLSPGFWHGVFANTPARVIAAAAVVSFLVQAVKVWAPNLISGKVAMALNLAASLSAVFVGMDPAHFWTMATLQQVAVVFAAAAGIHSTARSFFRNPGDKPAQDPTDAQTLRPLTPNRPPEMMLNSAGTRVSRMFLVGGAMLFGALFLGCTHQTTAMPKAALAPGAVDQVDMTANQTLQTIHAFLATITAQIQNGTLTLTQPQLIIVDDANRSANVADTAEKAYHAAGGGDSSVLSAALAAAQSAFAGVQASMATGVTK